ncbi:hypothetical protein HZS_2391 [Henneguya salminicola]|nr:hypothetical protein HZS_2391 [Henneguya salminicola]
MSCSVDGFCSTFLSKRETFCDQNQSAVPRITGNNTTPKMVIENYVDENSAKINLHRATTESFAFLKYNSYTFIDSPVRCTPHPFMQCHSNGI